jgi:uncharacterized protein
MRRHGFWAGSWIGFARICRCGPWGSSGIDLVDDVLPPDAAWHRPWRYGRWRGVNAPQEPLSAPEPFALCEAVEPPIPPQAARKD